MPDTVVIDPRFCGPAGSANGGYASGLAARWLPGPAEVSLRVPPPLGRALTVDAAEERVRLLDGDVVVAEARRATVDEEVPAPVAPGDARRAAVAYPWRDRHPYPPASSAAPSAAPATGCASFPDPSSGGSSTPRRGPRTPRWPASTAGSTPRSCGALDCPSGIVTDRFGDVGRILLGRLAVAVHRPVAAGEAHVVQAWTVARDGRKLHTASALLTADGELCAQARAVWITVAAAG